MTTLTKAQQKRFDSFWSIYPRRQAKGNALSWWKRNNPDEQLTNKIVAAVKAQVKAGQIKKNDRYTRLPATWLNGYGWEDEIICSRPMTDAEIKNYIETKRK